MEGPQKTPEVTTPSISKTIADIIHETIRTHSSNYFSDYEVKRFDEMIQITITHDLKGEEEDDEFVEDDIKREFSEITRALIERKNDETFFAIKEKENRGEQLTEEEKRVLLNRTGELYKIKSPKGLRIIQMTITSLQKESDKLTKEANMQIAEKVISNVENNKGTKPIQSREEKEEQQRRVEEEGKKKELEERTKQAEEKLKQRREIVLTPEQEKMRREVESRAKQDDMQYVGMAVASDIYGLLQDVQSFATLWGVYSGFKVQSGTPTILFLEAKIPKISRNFVLSFIQKYMGDTTAKYIVGGYITDTNIQLKFNTAEFALSTMNNFNKLILSYPIGWSKTMVMEDNLSGSKRERTGKQIFDENEKDYVDILKENENKSRAEIVSVLNSINENVEHTDGITVPTKLEDPLDALLSIGTAGVSPTVPSAISPEGIIPQATETAKKEMSDEFLESISVMFDPSQQRNVQFREGTAERLGRRFTLRSTRTDADETRSIYSSASTLSARSTLSAIINKHKDNKPELKRRITEMIRTSSAVASLMKDVLNKQYVNGEIETADYTKWTGEIDSITAINVGNNMVIRNERQRVRSKLPDRVVIMSRK